MNGDRSCRIIGVNGVVQGVGFRPFVFQLAKKRRLKGEVSNTSSGVVIRLEGDGEQIGAFLKELEESPPPLAHITDISVDESNCRGFADFTIAASRENENKSTLISPDMAVCDDCLRELFDPGDRRYEYPFINCTNCGPRYTIIEDIPYDRPKTSMKNFKMCEACRREYEDPENRRFHAQPNACPDCGPKVTLCDSAGEKIECPDPVSKTAQLLLSGRIVAVKGLGGFHLAVRAEKAEAVDALRKRKHREEKPFAIMAPDMETVRAFAVVKREDENLLRNARRPIVILEKKHPNAIAEQVSPRNRNFGVMLPYTPLHYLLLEKTGKAPLVMTSGNISEEPICIDNKEAFERLAGIADYFLVHDRDIHLRSDDSIARNMSGAPRFLRRSRGYAPMPVFLRKKIPSVLACGAELKNTICLTKNDKAFLSQHIGDLENVPTLDFFKMTIEHMKRIIDVEPELIACDAHPDYLGTRFALEQRELPAFKIQHHHAHIVSCMAENREKGPVIGLAFDGTGYGTDGAVWGCEVLVADEREFERAAHPEYVRMPGGAAAIREPWRMAVAYLHHVFGADFTNLDIPFMKNADTTKTGIVVQMIEKGINAPRTSSLGRLFDGVAALCGIRDRVAFEGQAAMELEMAAAWPMSDSYDFEWSEGERRIISLAPIIEGIVSDLQKRMSPAKIGGKFHSTLIRMFSKLCDTIGKDTGIKTVALSGGSFQNDILFSGMIRKLREAGFQVIAHRTVPCNDGGTALGQAVSAAALHEYKQSESKSPYQVTSWLSNTLRNTGTRKSPAN